MSARQVVIIGLCGGSASGKSSLADLLQTLLPPGTAVLRQDWYYHDCSHLTAAQRARQNFDHPVAIDLQAFAADLQQLRAGQAIQAPEYCFRTHTSHAGKRQLAPASIVIAEGLFLYNNLSLNAIYDLKVFIHADSDLRLLRRMQRDIVQRGRSLDSVSTQYLETVKPMHDQHVEPNKQEADLVINPTNLEQLADCADTIASHIRQLTGKAGEPSPRSRSAG